MSSRNNPVRRDHYGPYFIGEVTREGNRPELTQLQCCQAGIWIQAAADSSKCS